MKKDIIKILQVLFVLLIAIMMGLSVTGCNYSGYDFIDTNYHFNKAYIKTPYGGVLSVDIAKWADSEDGEQITITAKDGTRYMVHSANVMFIESVPEDVDLGELYEREK